MRKTLGTKPDFSCTLRMRARMSSGIESSGWHGVAANLGLGRLRHGRISCHTPYAGDVGNTLSKSTLLKCPSSSPKPMSAIGTKRTGGIAEIAFTNYDVDHCD